MTRLRQWWNRNTRCWMWGCQPPDDGTWWRSQSGMVIITPETKDYCAHCGGRLI